MKRFNSSIATIFCLSLFFLHLPFSVGQDILATSTAKSGTAPDDGFNPMRITVDVSEVSLDVVVVDSRGRPIADLTAADFEIYQDRLPQTVTSSVYISNQTDTARNDNRTLQTRSTPVQKEDVRRTILFVVDNLSMQYEHLHYAKTAMKGFLGKQMHDGDLVAIMRTGYGNSALQMFLSDKPQLIARIDRIPADGAIMEQDPDNFYRIYDNQLSTLSYSLRALKDMPGRKILIFMSSLPMLVSPPPAVMEKIPVNYYELYGPRFERLGTEALRAGVVVHALNTRGLEHWIDKEDEIMSEDDNSVQARIAREKAGMLNPLPAKTGGIYVGDSNFFANGIGNEVNNMIAGYYLVSYTPPATTFKASRKNVFHRVNVRVKRRGAVVHTRDGFYGIPDDETDFDTPPTNPLYNAVFSPFQYPDLSVNLTAGYIRDTHAGYILRSWIHLDAKDLNMSKTEEGARIDLETVCLTSDINGTVHDLKYVGYTFDVKPENIAWIQKHGIRFSLLLPVKNPGAYSVHIAIQDMESGRIGSAYQFVEVPDLGKKELALSDIFMITSVDDLNWMLSDVTEENSEGAFSTVFQEGEVRSPALRTYVPGDKLQTLAILYNADSNAIARSEIEMQTILYKDGEEFLRGDPRPVIPNNTEKMDSILILRSLTMGSDMPSGDYIQQLVVTDKKNGKKKDGVASQTLNFIVTGK